MTGQSFPEVFGAVVARQPEHLALVDDERTLTYADVWRETRCVARALPPTDRPTEVPVAVLVRHGVDAVVQILGVVMGGRIAAPLDTHEPADRLARMVASAGAGTVLTSRVHLALATEMAGSADVVVFDDIDRRADDVADLAPIDPSMPATIYFTSGSTGVPKGVVEDHASLVASGLMTVDLNRFTPDDRLALTSSLAFASARARMANGLLGGSTVYLYDVAASGPRGVYEFVARHGITFMSMTPTVLRAIADTVDHSLLTSVRQVNFSGEPFYGTDVDLARAVFGEDTVLQNMLGSSESHRVASYVVPPGPVPPGVVPVGTPPYDADVRLVDDDGNDVPDGEVGAFEVVSPYVAREYWRDPELTAERFITTPDGRRGFRTSDRGRRRPDGLYEHLGRLDDRVKVHGAMVSPSEVERALVRIPDVARAAVVSRSDPDGRTRLDGYVELARGTAPAEWQLRRDLAALVPAYMVPATITPLESIPRSPRGKLDHDALPPPSPVVRPPHREPVGREREIALLFGEVLGVSDVGRDDDFFALGGDSLAATELLAAIDEDLHLDLRASELVESPTVAALAERLVVHRAPGAPLLARLSGAAMPALLCVPGGGEPGVVFRPLADAIGGDRAVWALQARGLEERARPDRSVERMAARFVAEVTAAQPTGPYLLCGYSFGGLVAFEMTRQLEASGCTVALLAILDTGAVGTRRTRRDRVASRASSISEDVEGNALARAARVAGRSIRWSVRSAKEHASRRIVVASAGVVPRKGVEQYDVFYRYSAHLTRRYRPRATVAAPTLVVRAAERTRDPGWDLGWSDHVQDDPDVIEVPGDHHTLRRRPHVTRLGTVLRDAIAAALAASNRSAEEDPDDPVDVGVGHGRAAGEAEPGHEDPLGH